MIELRYVKRSFLPHPIYGTKKQEMLILQYKTEEHITIKDGEMISIAGEWVDVPTIEEEGL